MTKKTTKKSAESNPYSAYYRDSRWQKKRLEIMERDGWRCRSCGKGGEGVTLNVHHAYYEKGKKPWEYDGDMLVTWCEGCHMVRHNMMEQIMHAVASWPLAGVEGIWLIACNDLQEVAHAVHDFQDALPPQEDLYAAIQCLSDVFSSGRGTRGM